MKREYIINRLGKDFVLYEGLLDQAHQEGLKRVSTMLLQVPNDENGHMAIVSAEVETGKGVFSGLGDASPSNVNRNIAPHLIRMAETRAKARALRDAVNVGVTALEELGADIDDEVGVAREAGASPNGFRRVHEDRPAPTSAAPAQPEQSEQPEQRTYDGPKASPHKPASANQLATITKLARLVGVAEESTDGMSAADASERITELSRMYNERKGSGMRQTA